MMKKKLLILVSLFALYGCSDNADKCTDIKSCDGNRIIYCHNGEKITENCPANQTCMNGECVPDGSCSAGSFAPYCQNNTAFICENGSIKTSDCAEQCINGVCISSEKPECSEDFVPVCSQTGRTICRGGHFEDSPCPQGMVCLAGNCVISSDNCGNGTVDSGENCDDGEENGRLGKCRKDCSGMASCGDGIVDSPDEMCDDGEENGKYGKCRVDCLGTASCGDGVVDSPDEACDDGVDNGQYGKCRVDCQSTSKCGDGVVDLPNEVCDEGAENGAPGRCISDCSGVAGCGNGVVDSGESCDPPSTDVLVSCTSVCQKPVVLFPEFPLAENVSTQFDETCDSADLWQKYLRYRERFVGNASKHIPGFVSWGKQPGESLPAESRDPNLNCEKNWRLSDCGYNNTPDSFGYVNWSDTSLWLGIMMHWLALEYRVFELLGIDTTETLKYLSLAIQAFDRLDLAAEPYFGMEAKLDGFFIRDDIPHSFAKKEDNSYRFERTDGEMAGYACAGSGNTCVIYNGKAPLDMLRDGTFVSQDQVTGLYEGFGMVAKFVPDSVEYDGIKIRHAARSAVDRIVKYMRDNNWCLGVRTDKGWQQIPDDWGGYAGLFSGFFAEGANSICAPDLGTENYHNEASDLAMNTIPTFLQLMWPMWETKNNYNRNLALRILNYTNIWNDETYIKYSMESGRDFWALSHALYWDRALPDDYPLWRFHTILASAPCNGSCNGLSCSVTPGWMGENYFITPNDRVGSRYNEGEYNGLDYLITYNLYLLAYAQKTGRPYTHVVPKASGKKGLLQTMIDNSYSKVPDSYYVSENVSDMNMLFCGRPFVDWIRDNALGLNDIYTGKMRWECQMDGNCKISVDDKPYTHHNSLIVGTNSQDIIDVPEGYHHCIVGLGGDDIITARTGYHFIDGGDGNDLIEAEGAQVTVYGGNGNDTIKLGAGLYVVDSGEGNDTVTGGDGTYLIHAGNGNDTIRVGNGPNRINGGDGDDIIEVGSGDNAIWGNDKINAGNGDNLIWTGSGSAFVKAGNGDNSIQTDEPQNNQVYICFGTGKNSIYAGWSSTSYCSAAQNSDIHQNSCNPVLTENDCSNEAYDNWQP